MIDAFLKGKLSGKQENMEDILTSLVIGTMKYYPPEKALMPFLSKAELASGKKPFKDICIDTADYQFWQKIKEGSCNICEPDVLLTLTQNNKDKIIVMIEAKYHSGKSSFKDDSETPNDQLAKEWFNLKLLADKENATPYLIYLTTDFGFPAEEINESQKELAEKGEDEGQICWLSWRHFPLVSEIQDIQIISDISKILRDKLNLIFFEGISIGKRIDSIDWNFVRNFEWDFSPQKIDWHFKQ